MTKINAVAIVKRTDGSTLVWPQATVDNRESRVIARFNRFDFGDIDWDTLVILRTEGKPVLIKVAEYPLWDDRSFMKELRCVNHPKARYLTKNPYDRSIFVDGNFECDCPLSDMRVYVDPAVDVAHWLGKASA
jgi:hypothetical protein